MKTKVENIKLKEKFKNNYSKAKVILLLLIIGLSTKILLAEDKYSFEYIDRYCLEMKGIIKPAEYKGCETQKNIDSADVSIFTLKDKLLERLYSNELGECFFKLPLNEQYVVKISKKGWVTKILNIDTRLEMEKLKKYEMFFEVEMFEDVNELNIDVLNQPIANVYFDDLFENFDYNYEYTNRVNRSIEKMYLNYYKFHKKVDTIHDKVTNVINNSGYTEYPSNNTELPLPIAVKNNSNPNLRFNNLDNTKDSYKTFYKKKYKDQVVYKIQVLALEGSLPSCASFFKKCGKPDEYFHEGKYKYTLGEFKSFEIALNRLDMMRKIGYSDAFLVAFVNGNRINLIEDFAIQLHIKE
jgi:hypothetical protein